MVHLSDLQLCSRLPQSSDGRENAARALFSLASPASAPPIAAHPVSRKLTSFEITGPECTVEAKREVRPVYAGAHCPAGDEDESAAEAAVGSLTIRHLLLLSRGFRWRRTQGASLRSSPAPPRAQHRARRRRGSGRATAAARAARALKGAQWPLRRRPLL